MSAIFEYNIGLLNNGYVVFMTLVCFYSLVY